MNCPDIEKIIQFAAGTPAISDAELAAHINNCIECQRNLAIAIDVIHCDYEISESDLQDAANLTAKTAGTPGVLADIMEFISEQLKKMPMLSVTSVKIPHLQPLPVLSFASGGKTRIHTQKRLPEIPFVSIESKCSLHYWHASFQLPMVLHESGSIQVTVVDRDNNAIDEAVLTIGGVSIKICNGKSELTFNDFKKSTVGSDISLQFSDGCVSPGVIELQ